MKKSKEIYIGWMLESVNQIQEYTKGMNHEAFERNGLVHDACLMQFQHLGETANKLKTNFPEDVSLPYREIVWFRNFIAHDYIGIALADVWDTVIQDLPWLRTKLVYLLENSVSDNVS